MRLTKMELIEDERKRLLTFNKRKTNLLKKASDFSTLCGVDVCVVVFGPAKDDLPVIPETWPSDIDRVRSIIERFRMSDKPKKSYQITDYFVSKKKVADMKLAKLQKEMYRAKFPVWNDRLDTFSEGQLRIVLAGLDARLEDAVRKLETLKAKKLVMDKSFRGLPGSSQLNQSFSYDIKDDIKNDTSLGCFTNTQLMPYSNHNSLGCFTNTQLVPYTNLFDNQQTGSFQSRQSSQRTSLDPYLLDRSSSKDYQNSIHFVHDANAYASLQPCPYTEPFQFEQNSDTYFQTNVVERKIQPFGMQLLDNLQTSQGYNAIPISSNFAGNMMATTFGYQNGSDHICARSLASNPSVLQNKPAYTLPSSWMGNTVIVNNDDPIVNSVAPSMQRLIQHLLFAMPGSRHPVHSFQVDGSDANVDDEMRYKN